MGTIPSPGSACCWHPVVNLALSCMPTHRSAKQSMQPEVAAAPPKELLQQLVQWKDEVTWKTQELDRLRGTAVGGGTGQPW